MRSTQESENSRITLVTSRERRVHFVLDSWDSDDVGQVTGSKA